MSIPVKTYANRLSRGAVRVGGLSVGGDGVMMAAIRGGTVGIDPPAIGATSNGTATVLLPGVEVGDIVILVPETVNNGMIYGGAQVTGAGTVSAYFLNTTGGSLNIASADWQYLHIDLTP